MTRVTGSRTYAGQAVEVRQRLRRERFLESGLTIFARDGYANSSVGAICKDAGLSSRQFYEEFTGREALLVELFDRIERESRDAVASALTVSSGQGVRAMIGAAVRAYVESIGRDPRRARVGLVEVIGASVRMETYRIEQRRLWEGLLQAATADLATHGEIPRGDLEMRVSALLGAVNYVVYDWSISDPRSELDNVIRVLVETLIGAIGADRA